MGFSNQASRPCPYCFAMVEEVPGGPPFATKIRHEENCPARTPVGLVCLRASGCRCAGCLARERSLLQDQGGRVAQEGQPAGLEHRPAKAEDASSSLAPAPLAHPPRPCACPECGAPFVVFGWRSGGYRASCGWSTGGSPCGKWLYGGGTDAVAAGDDH